MPDTAPKPSTYRWEISVVHNPHTIEALITFGQVIAATILMALATAQELWPDCEIICVRQLKV